MPEYDSSSSSYLDDELNKLNNAIRLYKYPMLIFTMIFIIVISFSEVKLKPAAPFLGPIFWPIFASFLSVHFAIGFRAVSIASYIKAIRAANRSPSYDERKLLEKITHHEGSVTEATVVYMNIVLTIMLCKLVLGPALAHNFNEALSVITGMAMLISTIRAVIFCATPTSE